jgi:hypothetical protein
MMMKVLCISAAVLMLAFLFGCIEGSMGEVRVEDDSAVIEWSTQEMANTELCYFTEEYDLIDCYEFNEYTFGHRVELDGLEEETAYIYEIYSYDESGERYFFYMGEFTTTDVDTDPGAIIARNVRIIDEVTEAGKEVTATVYLENEREEDLRNVRITVVIPELALRTRIGPFDLDEGDELNKKLLIDIPEGTPPGEYIARITISDMSGNVRKVKHRYITVV